MSDVGSCCALCGKEFQQLGRGRPRVKCFDCSPCQARPPARPAVRGCDGCGAKFEVNHLNRRYCTAQCRYRTRDLDRRTRLGPRCRDCGERMWPGATSAPEGEAKCLPCRRKAPGFRPTRMRARGFVQSWTCQGCGTACERPAMKGTRPKWCETCRRIRRNHHVRVTPTVRMAIYERDGWICWLCEGVASRELIGTRDHWRPSLDHVIPKSQGGPCEPSNLRLAHWWCNSVRNDGRTYTEEDFRVAS